MQLFSRLKLALTEEHPSAPEFDQNQWVDLADSSLPIEISIQLLDSLNQRVVAIGENVSNSDLERKVNLEGTGEMHRNFSSYHKDKEVMLWIRSV